MSQASSSAATAPTAATATIPELTLDQGVQEIKTSTDSKALSSRLSPNGAKESKERDKLLSGNLSDGQDPLSVLDPEQHTLGFLYIL